MKKEKEKKEKKLSTARLRYLHISPRKVRKIADTIRNLSVLEAESELLYRPQRAANSILKLLRSAVSNIKNPDIKKESLFVDEIRVDKGPIAGKKLFPRARGRGDMIKRKTSHIFLSLRDLKKPVKRKYKIPSLKMIKSDKFVKRYKWVEKEEVVKGK